MIAVVQNSHTVVTVAAIERIILLFKVLQDHFPSARNCVCRVIFHRLQLVLILRTYNFIRAHIKPHVSLGKICQNVNTVLISFFDGGY